ncbi:hypothetical protein CMQ_7667 [Grosmannia clavigera kw1407]|uniref:Chalcone isomerase domain-containing protein n=1 Tax=Grosmannia clavigera (strain kw1407 / UAMH 11150) TaxID=655863 RepID=F0XP22_GROCL|nr:uncharacterized protein CMQ_7667 [Grosmannia clavigera kw1407]EFX00665.1 hypothetical protein CMQ_7667 [Grosmannia clavigera kw1407]
MIRRVTTRVGSCSQLAPAKCIRLATPLQRRTFLSTGLRSRSDNSRASFDTLNVERLARERQDYDRTRLVFLAAGSVAGIIATIYTAFQLKNALEKNPTKLDAGPTYGSSLAARKVIVHDKEGNEVVPTGDSTVTEFPRTLNVPVFEDSSISSAASPQSTSQSEPTTEYTLVGLGVRTVSFLSIRVYVVGYYVATADIAALQSRLVKRVDPIATALVSGEKDELRAALLDPVKSEEIWNTLLEDGVPLRSAFRIVPVRDTDFPHLRDGLVRAIQARASMILPQEQVETPSKGPEFGESVRQFRQLFNRGKVLKRKELLLLRGEGGRLSIVYDDGRSFGRQYLGSVEDERLSRVLWLNYLGGSKVASEPARQSIVNGVIEFVERPVGTVATQVV